MKTLRNLRLTSKAFGDAATAILFQSTHLVWKVGELSEHTTDFPLIGHIERSDASKIKFLRIDFQSWGDWNGRHTGCFEAAEEKIHMRPQLLETPFGVIPPADPCGNFEWLVGFLFLWFSYLEGSGNTFLTNYVLLL